MCVTARCVCSVCAVCCSWGQLIISVSEIGNVKLVVNFIVDFSFLLYTNMQKNVLCQSDCGVFTQRESTGRELGGTEVK